MSSKNLINKNLMLQLCAQLKLLRLERGLSLEELQEKVHINVQLLQRIEDGKCLPFGYFWRLAAFYEKKVCVTLE
jgi:transcriptional regulator with XRE-family HTH domain